MSSLFSKGFNLFFQIFIAISFLTSNASAFCHYIDCSKDVLSEQLDLQSSLDTAFKKLDSTVGKLDKKYGEYLSALKAYNEVLEKYKKLKAVEAIKSKEIAFFLEKQSRLANLQKDYFLQISKDIIETNEMIATEVEGKAMERR